MLSSFLNTLYSRLEIDYHLRDNMLSYFDDISPEDVEYKEAMFFE